MTSPFSTLLAERREVVDDLVESISGGESKRFGGYLSSSTGNKGMRGGLLEGKQAIRQTSPLYITEASAVELVTETPSFMTQLKCALCEQFDALLPSSFFERLIKFRHVSELRALNDMLANLLEARIQQFESFELKRPFNLQQLMALRRDYSNSLLDELIGCLTTHSNVTAKKLERIQEFIQNDVSKHIDHTDVTVEFSEKAFLNQCIANVNQEESKYQRLPGDEGLYEIVGLKGVASRLEYVVTKLPE